MKCGRHLFIFTHRWMWNGKPKLLP